MLGLSLAPLLLAGCASAPRSETPVRHLAQMDCPGLAAERAQAQQARDAAAASRSGSWKFVVPIAVGVRYATANAALAEADERLAAIEARQQAGNCRPAALAATSD